MSSRSGTGEGIPVEAVMLFVIVGIDVVGAGHLENRNGRRRVDMGTATEIDEVATLVNLPLYTGSKGTEMGEVAERIIPSL